MATLDAQETPSAMNRQAQFVRRRSLPKMLLLLALPVVTIGLNACKSNSTGPTEPTGPSAIDKVLYGTCGMQPNYASLVGLHRFAKFPITVSVNVSPSLGLNAKWTDLYRQALVLGAGMWGEVMTGGIGQVSVAYDNPAAAIQMSLVNVTPASFGMFQGSAQTTYNPSGLATSSRIELYRYLVPNLSAGIGTLEPRVDRGELTSTAWAWYLAGFAAHEMGHALVTDPHAPAGNLMSPDGDTIIFGKDYRSYFSAADKNTMNEAYCR
jgi:hypothetical protein